VPLRSAWSYISACRSATRSDEACILISIRGLSDVQSVGGAGDCRLAAPADLVVSRNWEALVSDKEKAERIVNKHVLWSVGAGLVPLPVLDIVAVTAIQIDMLRQIAAEYGVSFSETAGKAWVSALAGNVVARVGANALKLIPGIGTVLGGVSGAVVAGASTYAIGQVALTHFESGGTFADLDMNAARRVYDQEIKRGKQVAEDLSRDKRNGLDKLERLGRLRDKGVISAEEFEEQKKRVLASM
jgi:uncharacterized protein (DUF697 family)